MKKPQKKPKGSPKQQSGEKKAKKKYKVRNWKEYNEALVNRGRVMFWITEEAIEQWEEKQKTGKRGKPKVFSDTAIQTALTLREVFSLPLRQTEGFLTSILAVLNADVRTPDFTTLDKRMQTLTVGIRIRGINDTLHIVVDSTGAKVYGDGEWKVRKHGWSKHRTWKKLHLGIDEATGDILMAEVTGNDKTDGEMLESLLNQLPDGTVINQISADGAYDKRKCYEALRKRRVQHVAIPPQHNAKIWQHGNRNAEQLVRDKNLRRIRVIGRKQWKVETNYHRRSLSETGMFRIKTVFGDRVAARTDTRQRTELLLRCYALNKMTALGMPKSSIAA